MPRCENTECEVQIGPAETHEDAKTGQLICSKCADDREVVKLPDNSLVLGREFNYGFSYDRRGLRGFLQLGGAKASLEVSQEELSRTFGPPR